MPKARKEHRCTLCSEVIPLGVEYHWERITPWDHPDNEVFFTFKAHVECLTVWRAIGALREEFPPGSAEWQEMVEEYEAEQAKEAKA